MEVVQVKKRACLLFMFRCLMCIVLIAGVVYMLILCYKKENSIIYDRNSNLVFVSPKSIMDETVISKLFDGSSLYIVYSPEGSLPDSPTYDESLKTPEYLVGINRFKSEKGKPLITLVKCVNGVYNSYMYMNYSVKTSTHDVCIEPINLGYTLETKEEDIVSKGFKDLKPILNSILYSYEGGISKER